MNLQDATFDELITESARCKEELLRLRCEVEDIEYELATRRRYKANEAVLDSIDSPFKSTDFDAARVGREVYCEFFPCIDKAEFGSCMCGK